MARPATRGVLALAFACCGAGGRVLTAALPPVVEHGWLGLSADAYGLYARPTPALASLHEGYQFLRHHDMPAGRLDLDSVAAFGDSAHVRLQPALAPHAGITVASITLQLCGGNTTITLKVTVPESRTCASQKIFNNSNSAGWTTQKSTPAPNKTSASPAWCQALCCANPDCVGFTYTDPQPGDKANGDRYICWQYTSGPMKVVSGAGLCDGSGDGHCWSALGNARRTGTWSVEVREPSIFTSHLPPSASVHATTFMQGNAGAAVQVDGVPWAPNGTLMNAPRPVTSTPSDPTGSGGSYHGIDSDIEVFLDGPARQIFFNGNV